MNSSQSRDGFKNPATLKKDLFLAIFNGLEMFIFVSKRLFRCGKVHSIWHWIISIAKTSHKIVVKCDFLLNMALISTIEKFRVILLFESGLASFTTVVLAKIQRRFLNIFDFAFLFFQVLSKDGQTINWFNLHELSLLHVFYYIL